MKRGAYEIYDRRTGETVEVGYSQREARQSIAWKWNTGGDIWYLGVRKTPTPKPTRYVYAWGNNPRRAELKGRECVIEAVGRMRSVLLRFPDTGERVISSARSVRPTP